MMGLYLFLVLTDERQKKKKKRKSLTVKSREGKERMDFRGKMKKNLTYTKFGLG